MEKKAPLSFYCLRISKRKGKLDHRCTGILREFHLHSALLHSLPNSDSLPKEKPVDFSVKPELPVSICKSPAKVRGSEPLYHVIAPLLMFASYEEVPHQSKENLSFEGDSTGKCYPWSLWTLLL